jgi:hypothetical protein
MARNNVMEYWLYSTIMYLKLDTKLQTYSKGIPSNEILDIHLWNFIPVPLHTCPRQEETSWRFSVLTLEISLT